MDRSTARLRYSAQKNGARRRGIEWKFTFEQWLEWWGEDLDHRGCARDKLQMQRKLDRGAYEPGNCVKGYPKDNSRTYSNVKLARDSQRRAIEYQAALNSAPVVPSFDYETEDEAELASMFGVRRSYSFNNNI